MRKRRAQTAVEYILITLVLVVVFVVIHKAMQWACAQQFVWGGKIILRTYH